MNVVAVVHDAAQALREEDAVFEAPFGSDQFHDVPAPERLEIAKDLVVILLPVQAVIVRVVHLGGVVFSTGALSLSRVVRNDQKNELAGTSRDR